MLSLQRLHTGLLLALLTGCANQITIKSDYDKTAKFTGWKTFAWAPGTHTGLDDPRLNAAFIDPQVRADVNRELTGKGYVLGTPATADFLVSYHVTLDDETGKNQVTDGPEYSAFAVTIQDGNETAAAYRNPMAISYQAVYQVGTLSIRLGTPQPRKILWHGTAQTRIMENVAIATRQERLKNAVHLILAQFPPK
ncbi:MAG: DUF4136 domain-containing protein [Verrucomicrobiota bacterium]